MIFLLLALSVTSIAAPVCGTIDIGQATNDELRNIVFFADGARTAHPLPRTQCGLPGESLPVCSACAENTDEQMMTLLRPLLGNLSHSAWHAGWHRLRKAPTLADFSAYGGADAGDFATFQKLHTGQGELAGEDFFFMHRTMIKMVQLELAAAQLPCIAPWRDLPESIHDANWPVPKQWTKSSEESEAQHQLDTFRSRLKKLRDPAKLRKVSLNKFGLAIEAGLHQDLHNFYRSNPLCSAEGRAQGICDDLLPPETSAANKYFWKIHSLIDEMLGDWLSANGYQEISRDCEGRDGCYEWRGTWYGKYPRETQ